MSYQEKIAAALAAINAHNVANGAESAARVDDQKFAQSVIATGAITEDDLRDYLSREKVLKILVSCLPEGSTVEPSVLAAKVTDVLRGKKESDAVSATDDGGGKYVSSKKAHRMSHRELIECFDPDELDSPVAVRLRALSKGEPFLVYSQGRTVNIDVSVGLLAEIKAGHSGRTIVTVNGDPKEVYRIGELPAECAEAEENPLYINRPLRPDGTCDQLNRSWAGVAFEVRQFLRILLEERPTIISRVEDAHHYLDLVINTPEPMKILRQRYADIAIQFDKRKRLGTLPRLLIELRTMGKAEIHDRPFEDGKLVQWVAPPSPTSNYYLTAERAQHIVKNIVKTSWTGTKDIAGH